MRGASLQRLAKNSKLSKITYEPGNGRYLRPIAHAPFVSSTYVSIVGTCPPCPFKDQGCYAQSGMTGAVVKRLDEEVRVLGLAHDDVIEQEALFIESILNPDGRPLRLHVAGDCSSSWGVRRLARAAELYISRGGGPVWTYTHAWKEIPRSSWGVISVLASCEGEATIRYAIRRGYVPALVVPAFNGPNYFTRVRRFIPCPAETRGSNCADCRLCFDDHKLNRGKVGIAFLAHGQQQTRVKIELTQLKLGLK